ncbi:TonB-dependent siderophore receptor [Methylomonas rivi]|uniref:TonB-dependent receptor n=1 Tax=Methylomonas rivi TaxID=2952226 RepID=A0ABT1U8V1_9GAMM|nr:TonB-dependent receptor [Methylomonas sp. WSC-6]MCQ8129800.1 TonB-dependent receptor [Methylomonas sp. WSC-6]
MDIDRAYQFDIAAGPMSKALAELSDTSNLDINYPTNVANDVKSNGLKGSYTTEQALRQLLKGSDLSYRITGNSSVTVEKIQLAEAKDPTTMPAITVTGRNVYADSDPYNPNYNRTSASTATKTDTPIMETPINIQVVPHAVIQDQQGIQVGDAIKNVSGTFQGFTFGGFSEEFMIRGFNTQYANYLDGFRWNTARIPLANIERIEVVKGAAANLYGRIQPGGMINAVTKRPQATPYYALEQRFGSYDLYQTLADATGAINDDGSLMYRLNFEYLDKKSFRDFDFKDRVFLAPSLTWKISDRTQLDFDFIYSDENSLEDHGVVASATTRRPVNIPISRFLGEPELDKSRTTLYSTAITLNHSFSENWSINARFNYLNREVIDQQHAAPGGVLNETTGLLRRNFFGGPAEANSYGGTVNINGKFSTWGLKHNALVGWDYYGWNQAIDSWRLRPVAVGGIVNPINIFNPVYGQSGVNLANTPKNFFADERDSWNGVYFQDQITLFEKLHILGGGRYDWALNGRGFSENSFENATANFSNVESQKFSPRVGLLYQPWDWLSIYGNYVESLGAANTGIGVDGQIIQPETAEQYEIGFKTEFFDNRLISSFAFYQLTKQNMSVPIVGTGFSQAIGEAQSKGFEFDISGQVSEGLHLIASYAYTDAVIRKGTNAGNRLWNVPRNGGSFWAKYDLQQETLRGLTLGAGVFFQDQREGDMANSFELPGYARVDALIKYKLPIASAKTTFQLNVENLLDHQYYAGTANDKSFINPGAPRTFIGSIRVEF